MKIITLKNGTYIEIGLSNRCIWIGYTDSENKVHETILTETKIRELINNDEV